MAKYVFGIDLGTTYSCIAYVDETGRATVVNNSEGTNTTPSVVNFASPSQVVVGQVAKENAVIDRITRFHLVKTLMGKTVSRSATTERINPRKKFQHIF